LPVWCSDTAGLHRLALRAALGLAGAAVAGAALAQTPDELARQSQQYQAPGPKTILQLQRLRQTSTASLASGLPVRLISLNPGVNAWFLLETGSDKARDRQSYHLENPKPRSQSLTLRPDGTLRLAGPGGALACDLLSGDPPAIEAARAGKLPYAPICAGRLYLRNASAGTRSTRERVADFLRDHVWGGDAVVNFVKQSFYRDAFAETDKTLGAADPVGAATGPGAAPLNPKLAARPVIAAQMAIGLTGAPKGHMALGLWYPIARLDGTFASAIRPSALDPAILRGPGKANRLDAVEARATDYLVAFDLSRYTLGFALGTDHPRLGWSPRPPASVRGRGMPGPDGLNSARPLVRLGMVSPALTARTVAAFAGGYKRHHGAFRWGPFSTANHGSHYGFVEQGTVFSKLQPGLSTLYGLTDGTVGMKTWTEADRALLPRLVFARQNGVALIAPDPATGAGLPGKYVPQWGAGNWSGSADAQLRTLRAGACLKRARGTPYLIYAYFSTATPSAMARTFQAYGCHYAMQLDMNAPELTYLALYVRAGGQIQIEHLVPAMEASDKPGAKGSVIPRFLGYPDSRDLFYLYRKGG
jgi:hypothetical protein